MSQQNFIEFFCKDVRGKTIYCLNSRWQYLIKHKEMEDQQGVVRAVIETPEFIHQSRDFKNRQIYHKRVVLPSIGNAYIRVIVKFNFWRTRGYVHNAFAVKGPQKGARLIWGKN